LIISWKYLKRDYTLPILCKITPTITDFTEIWNNKSSLMNVSKNQRVSRVRNRQSRDTGNNGHTRYKKRTNKQHKSKQQNPCYFLLLNKGNNKRGSTKPGMWAIMEACLCISTIYWKGCTKPGTWAIMEACMCISGIELASVYTIKFSEDFGTGVDSIVFHLIYM
jgi:hypothetical protein